MTHTSLESPLRCEPVSTWIEPQANGREIRNSTMTAIHDTVVMIAPELSATDAA
jgi:hypothetical protein